MDMNQMRQQPNRTRCARAAKRATLAACIALSVVAHAHTAYAQDLRPDGPLRAAVRRLEAPTHGPSPQGHQPSIQQGPGWITRHPVIAGAAIGAGAGLALSQVDAIGGGNHDSRVALIGAGAGAWSGLIASAVHKARAGERISTGERIGLLTGAVGLIALPVLACYGAGGCGGSS